MQLSVDISLYPNREDFVPPILAFIEQLRQYHDIKLETFPTSTVMTGEFDRIMDILKVEMKAHRETHGMGIFVTKFLPAYSALS